MLLKIYKEMLKMGPFSYSKKGKIYVIISDALRYEVGDELTSIIRQEDMFEATIEPAISMLPSYTQLGMASLLPNIFTPPKSFIIM